MKIVFVVSCINSKSGGLGGHYHSLIETVNRLSKSHNVVIINVGNQTAKALENSSYTLYHIIHKKPAILKIQRRVNEIIKDVGPDVLHAFDSLAFLWVRKAGLDLNIPFCLTKCGGSNPVYFPYADNLILYSKENLNFFAASKKFSRSRLSLIPNRLHKFESDDVRIKALVDQLGNYNDSFRFLRISRIGPYYLRTAIQLIDLVRALSAHGINCCAIFIGTVEDMQSYEKLKEIASQNVFFFTSDEFCENAKALIDCADAVVGTGRSLMEASAKGKILLCPVDNSSIPLLIQKKNFEDAFHYNFSERTKVKNYSEPTNYREIVEVVSNPEKISEYRDFSYTVFDQNFDVAKLIEKHEEFYRNLKNPKRQFVDYCLHILFVFRKYYRS